MGSNESVDYGLALIFLKMYDLYSSGWHGFCICFIEQDKILANKLSGGSEHDYWCAERDQKQ